MLYRENTEQNGSEWSNGTAHFDRTGPTEKSGPPRLDLTDQFRFRPRFPEILVEWIAPYILEGITQNWAGYFARCVNHSMDGIWSAVFPVCHQGTSAGTVVRKFNR